MEMNALSNLLIQPLMINGNNQTLSFQYRLCEYLCANDLKSLRLVNHFCHRVVSTCRSFGSKVQIRISEKWHREYNGVGLSYGTRWENFVFDQFAYHRRHDMFKHYWTSSSKSLKELTLMNCSLECDGLGFILNECHNLGTLVIDGLKLKHWSTKNCARVHETVPVKTNPALEHNTVLPATTAMCQSLRTLKILNLKFGSNCAISYLKDRSGSLQNLVMKRNFQCHPKNPLDHSPEAVHSAEFHRKFGELIQANASTLQTLTVASNKYQADVLEMLINNLPSEQSEIKALKVTIRTQAEKEKVEELLQLPNVRPESLGIKILERFSEADVAEVLQTQYGVTKNLKLTFNGYKLTGLEAEERVRGQALPDFHEVDIQAVIHRFESLEALTLKDIKPVPEWSFRIAKGLRSGRREPAPAPQVREWADLKVKSGIHERFLYNMPSALKELTLSEIVFCNPESTNMASLRNITGYRSLTKLEIIGPLRYPLRNFCVIPKEMRKLKTLILVDCGLSDEEITGLNKVTAAHLKKCGAPVFHNLANGSGDAYDVFMRSIDKKIRKLTITANSYLRANAPDDAPYEGQQPPLKKRRGSQAEYTLPEYLQNKNSGDDDGLTTDVLEEQMMDHFEQLVEIGDARGIEPVEVREIPAYVPAPAAQELNHNEDAPEVMEQAVDPNDVLLADAMEVDAEEHAGGGDAPGQAEPAGAEGVENDVLLPNAFAFADDAEELQIQDTRSHIFMLQELEHLDLSKNCEVSNVTIYDSVKNPALKTLNLEECTRITDCALEWIAKYHPNLEVLHVKGCRKLSQFGFNQLIQKLPKLRRIYTTKKIALDEFENFNFNLSSCYKDITRYPDVNTTRAAVPLIQQNPLVE